MKSNSIDITKDLPYTILGYTAPPRPAWGIVLTAEGIKSIAERVEPGDTVHITVWDDVTNECDTSRGHQRIEIAKGEVVPEKRMVDSISGINDGILRPECEDNPVKSSPKGGIPDH